LLQRASVAALPSVWPEPFGLVGLEAAAFGVPSIAFDVGGIGQWLADGENGVLVPAPPAPEPFGEALARLLDNPRLLSKLRAGARQAAAKMPLSAHLDRLEAVFGAVRRRVPAAS
jgi:glycosyltransferase involved in cell wall biosynthesis